MSLSVQQQAALAELRKAAPEGVALGELAADWRTVESLVGRGLVEEAHVEYEDDPTKVRIRLTDAGWRVLQHLGPRAL